MTLALMWTHLLNNNNIILQQNVHSYVSFDKLYKKSL